MSIKEILGYDLNKSHFCTVAANWLIRSFSLFRTFVNPLLPVSIGLFAGFAWLLRDAGGPCAGPEILVLPLLLLVVALGLLLSAIRTFRHFRPTSAARPKAK